jgi:DNA repair protein RecN (Recombination protein N)
MIDKLIIQNYVIIDLLEFNLDKGLNIITGETGAGKSIILSALELVMGKRADLSSLKDKAKKCIVELYFDLSKYNLESFFIKHELDYDKELIIRREISSKGKSRSFINDTPCKLDIVKLLAGQIIDLHKQFDNLEIQDTDFHREVLDGFIGHKKILTNYQTTFQEYQLCLKEIAGIQKEQSEKQKELDYISFQYEELNNTGLATNEQEEKEAKVNIWSNAKDIQSDFSETINILELGENSVVDRLQQSYNAVSNYTQLGGNIEEISNRLSSILEEVQDLSKEISSVVETIDYDPEQLGEYQERLNEIYRLQKKYNVQTVSQLLDIQKDFQGKILSIDQDTQRLETLKNSKDEFSKLLDELALKIHKNRTKKSKALEYKILKLLKDLSFNNARFSIDIKLGETYKSYGKDNIEFLFSANKGVELQSLRKVASGGEISRLMLAIKSIVADTMSLPTLIFDEIDSGISGDVALRTGTLLSSISKEHQIISITHSPQVAARADKHFKIAKKEDSKTTESFIQVLTEKERVIELAKMLSGDPPSKSAVENAKELISL